jgi:hypothetical protein
VTLAAVCEARYGRSVLADVIRAGRDPHAYSAAVLMGRDPDEFLGLKRTDPDGFKHWRQMAKPLNFGIPKGAWAPPRWLRMPDGHTGVEMGLEQAEEFRRKLIERVYPEWGQYLAEDPMAILAENLGATVEECWRALDWKRSRSPGLAWAVRRAVRGETARKDGKPYHPRFIDGVWRGLQSVNRSEVLVEKLAGRQRSEGLERMLFQSGVVTLTRRPRGRVAYSQSKTAGFQGLAADGAKLALRRLVREGFRIVGFVHDEVLVELLDDELESMARATHRASHGKRSADVDAVSAHQPGT